MTDRLERRRQLRAARKDAKRSAFHDYPAEGVAPLPGSAGTRARELFIQAAEQGDGHPYAGMSRDDIRKAEHGRRTVPNRAAARKHGVRSGYTRRLAQRLAMGAEMRRIDRQEATAAMQTARKARREERAA